MAKTREELAKTLIGQRELVDRLLIGLLTGGHLLIEGMPGLAKTLAARSLALTIGAKFQRVQFTTDLLPSDLVGTEVYHPASGQFSIRKGPIFTNILLADEINRAPAKVQSALLEATQERQVTLAGETMKLPEPFLVLATQNPIETEGTYPLPEAQLDRFLLKALVSYPSRNEERSILRQMATTQSPKEPTPTMDIPTLLELRTTIDQTHMDGKIEEYILDMVQATRDPGRFGLDIVRWIEWGASPRATLALALAGKAMARLEDRDYVTPHDVKAIARDVLRHRLILSFEATAEGVTVEDVLERLLKGLAVP